MVDLDLEAHWLTGFDGCKGLSRYQAGGECVDMLTFRHVDLRLCRIDYSNDGTLSVMGGAAMRHGASSRVRAQAPRGFVVRALCGRAGDSLDGFQCIFGPPIPWTWTAATHWLLPARTRAAIHTVLLLHRRPETLFAKLNADLLAMLYKELAAWKD